LQSQKCDITTEAAPKRKVPYWLKPDKVKPTEQGDANTQESIQSKPKKVSVLKCS